VGIVASLVQKSRLKSRLHLLKGVKDFRNNFSYDCFVKRKIKLIS